MDILSNFILVKLNGYKEGKADAEKYAVWGYPTFIVANSEGTPLESWAGYSKSGFLKRATAAAGDLTTIDEKIARYEAGPTDRDAASLARYYDSTGNPAKAITYYESAEELNKDPDISYLMPVVETAFYAFRQEAMSFDQLEASASNLFASNIQKGEDLLLAARMILSAGRKAEKVDAALPYIEKAVKRTEGDTGEEVLKGRKRVMPEYAALVLKDMDKAVEYKRDSFKEGWQEDPAYLNSFAWWCFENNVNLEEAQALAMKGAELAESDAEKAQILDTAAEICNARDDCAKALALIKQAIELDPDTEHYKEQEKRFQELLAEKEGIR